jgi:hypothetical protein
VGARVVNPSLLETLGRPPAPETEKPDYIYVIALLHRMKRLPKLDFITHPRSEEPKADWARFQRDAAFFLGRLTEPEWERLRLWREANADATLFHRDQEHWAFITWSTG